MLFSSVKFEKFTLSNGVDYLSKLAYLSCMPFVIIPLTGDTYALNNQPDSYTSA